MRKLSFTLLPALIALVFISCKKEMAAQTLPVAPQQQGETVSLKIAPNETYTFNFSAAGNVTIVKQAAHFSVSETQAGEGIPLYKYTPAADFIGTDEVILQFDKSSGTISEQPTSGCSTHTSASATSVYTTFEIQVGN